MAGESLTPSKIKARLKRLDRNGDGRLDMWELKRLLRKGRPDITNREAELLFRRVDKNRDGFVDFNEFVDYCFSGGYQMAIKKRENDRRTELMTVKTAAEEEDIDWEGVKDAFEAFAGRNDTMEAWEFKKMCRDCKLFCDGFMHHHTDLVFLQSTKGGKHMGKEGFRLALRIIAKRKGTPAIHVRGLVANNEGPSPSKCTLAQNVRLHTNGDFASSSSSGSESDTDER
eukprot:TRINITY_DN7700_c1_g1_i2.p1 TRINITY_DN7700_c1_g1~~TRINITY_DN7700_c1_g1_i2.p1  ORF type:complete len:255 (+),score=50.50 TRINITY_DN7700_c1_g1_i2:83-766(+)